jgi:hypothetical protein
MHCDSRRVVRGVHAVLIRKAPLQVIDAVLDDASQYQNDLKYIRDQMQQAEGLNQILRWANRREESRRGELRASPWNRFLNKLAESAGYGRDSTHELQKVRSSPLTPCHPVPRLSSVLFPVSLPRRLPALAFLPSGLPSARWRGHVHMHLLRFGLSGAAEAESALLAQAASEAPTFRRRGWRRKRYSRRVP